MKRIFRGIVAVVVSVGWLAGLGSLGLAQDKPTTFELRRAETKPAKGLTEAVVEDTKEKVYLHPEAILGRKDIAAAKVGKGGDERPVVEVELTAPGAKKFAKATEEHLGKPLAILVNGKVITAPTLRSKIEGTALVIAGNFTQAEAERLARALGSK